MPVVAAVQLTSTSDIQANWNAAKHWIEHAARRGAELVATPENTNFLGRHDEKVRLAESLDGDTCGRFADLAGSLGIYLLLGSFNESTGEPDRCYNTSVLFGPDGERLAVYRKIHLFDVDVSPEVRFVESATVKPGTALVTASTPLGHLGLTICYDLRFPEIYRALRNKGAEILMVPSAFTMTTGRDHWMPLLRARAIENQCFLVAPAQCGLHNDDGLRESYGHAMIIDPWGDVMAMASTGPGVVVAEIELTRIAAVRSSMPVWEHRRL